MVSNETKTYQDGELFSASQTIYTRDSISLQSSQHSNYLDRTGSGYTIQYSLVAREFNKEIWEYLRKAPGRDVELLAEIREYSKLGMKVLSQVGNTDSTSIKLEYKYREGKQISELIFYKEEKIIRHSHIEYDKLNFARKVSDKTILKDGSSEITTEELKYELDEKGNPIKIMTYGLNDIMSITENKIYYRK